MLSFIAAVYNEEDEIDDLISHVRDYVDYIFIADDGSTDETENKLAAWEDYHFKVGYKRLEHTGLPETVKNEALKMVPDGSWVLMLDADERFAPGVLQDIVKYLRENPQLDYVVFRQIEIIDGVPVREFQKVKLFKKEAIRFPLNNIHADDQFVGEGSYYGQWVVLHRKTSDKQKKREREYLETYQKLFDEGKIDEGRLNWLRGLHHFIR